MAMLLPILAGAAASGAAGLAGSFGSRLGNKISDVFGFKKGGIVQGKRGEPKMIMAHAGELVVPAHLVSKLKSVMKKTGQKVKKPPMKSKPVKRKKK